MAVVDVVGAADTVVELADALLRDAGRVDFLQHLSRACAQLVPGRATAVLLTRDVLDSDGEPTNQAPADTGIQSLPWLRVYATSSSVAARVALLESRVGQGPCWQALATRQSVLGVDLHTRHQQWPDLVPAALAEGIGTVSASLLHRHEEKGTGVLAIYHAPQEVASVSDTALTRRMVDVATTGLLTHASSPKRELLARQLRSARHSRVLIEQAAGVLAFRANLSVSNAATQLQQQARWAGLTVTAIAAAIIDDAVTRPGESAGSASRRENHTHQALAGVSTDREHEIGAVRASCNEVDLLILRLFWTHVDAPVIAGALGWTILQLARRMADIRARLGVASTAAAVDAAHRLGLLESPPRITTVG